MADHLGDDVLLELALDQIREPERAHLVGHLSTCPRCRYEYDQVSATIEQTLGAAPRVEPEPGFDTRVVAAMGFPASGRARWGRALRSRWGLVAAATVVGLLLGAGGALVVTAPDEPPVETASVDGVALTTGDGQQVGTVARSVADGEPVFVIMVTDGPVGMHYECVLRLEDGRKVGAGEWTLESTTATWVIGTPAVEVAELSLVTDRGAVWSSTRL